MQEVVNYVDVERDGDGPVRVSWDVSGPCRTVDVAWGHTAEAIDHEHVVTMAAEAGETTLDAIPAGRIYVSVAPTGTDGAVVSGTRRLGLPGPTNLRDLGGYRGGGGRVVRWGRVFRSDALVLEDTAFDGFAGLGIRVIYDLRSDEERETNPNRLPAGDYVVRHFSLAGEDSARPAIEAGLTDGEAFLSQLYVQMLEASAPSVGAIITGLSDDSQLPAIFHCAAGKDRTGIVATVLLLALGVDQDVVLDDYELTSRYRTAAQVQAVMARLEKEQSMSAEVVAGILRTPRWAMQAAVKEIERRYEGIEGYLTRTAGVTPDTIARLRSSLLT